MENDTKCDVKLLFGGQRSRHFQNILCLNPVRYDQGGADNGAYVRSSLYTNKMVESPWKQGKLRILRQ